MAARKEMETLQALLDAKPDAQGLAAILYTLQGHYWQSNMPAALAKRVVDDYMRLLADYSPQIMQIVSDKCKLDPERQFFPKVGQLDDMAKSELWRTKYRHMQLAKLLDAAGVPA